MILSYIESMGESLRDIDESDLPQIELQAVRLNRTIVEFTDLEYPETAPRRWSINWEPERAGNGPTITHVSEDTNFHVVVEKDNRYGTIRYEARFVLPRNHSTTPGGFNNYPTAPIEFKRMLP